MITIIIIMDLLAPLPVAAARDALRPDDGHLNYITVY